MTCTHCQHLNDKDAKFCNQCGTKLAFRCSQCGKVNQPNSKFCKECGKSLSSGATDSKIDPDPKNLRSNRFQKAERRQLTVLFCDLVGSTSLSEKLDAEEFRQVILNYQQIAEKVIKRYGGHVGQYLGDGLLVYFGYPEALEHAPNAGVRAGLGILEAVAYANQQWKAAGKTTIRIRIGIHTGLVVVDEHMALGETTNVASRLEGLAPLNGLVISPQTKRLVQGWFEIKSLGMLKLKGISKPMEVFQVLHESGARSRMDLVKSKGLGPLLGRQIEFELILEKWGAAKAGDGSLILLSGEAGIGKSRLVEAIKEKIIEETDSWLTEIRCSSFHQNTAFYPIIEVLENMVLRFKPEDGVEQKLVKLEGFVIQSGLDYALSMFLLTDLLNIPYHAPSEIKLESALKKKKTKQVLLQGLLHRASEQPVLLVTEDLHWADPSTMEWLRLLAEVLPQYRILTLCTTRPTPEKPEPFSWMDPKNMKKLPLKGLQEEEIEAICYHQTKGKALPREVLNQIKDKTDGIPLFVEELTQMVLESEIFLEKEDQYELSGTLPELAIPSTLQDSLLVRIDRLGPAKETAQLGATLGRSFPYKLLLQISGLPEEPLQNRLQSLLTSGLIYQKGEIPDAVFVFKHALVQDAAYQSQLISRRRQVHVAVAKTLESKNSSEVETPPELIAHHFFEGRLFQKAAHYWQKAGVSALVRSASWEASANFQKAIEALRKLPATRDRHHHELKLLVSLIAALRDTKGYVANETVAAIEQAHQLLKKVKDFENPFPIYYGLLSKHLGGGELKASKPIVKNFLDRALESENDGVIQVAERLYGLLEFYIGSLSKAAEVLDNALHRKNIKDRHFLAMNFGHDSGIASLNYYAWVKYLSGFPDQARHMSEQALEQAEHFDHANTRGHAFGMGIFLGFIAEDIHHTKKCVSLLDGLLEVYPLPVWKSFINIANGWLQTEQKQFSKGLKLMNKGLAQLGATGTYMFQSAILILLAKVYLRHSQFQKADHTLNELLSLKDKTGETRWSGELLRLRGELLLHADPDQTKEIESFLEAALQHSKVTKARLLQLRAATSLSKFWQLHGKTKQAIQLLEPLYNSFDEGHDNPSLQEGRTQLERLRSGPFGKTHH